MGFAIMKNIIVARAPPHQKVGDSYLKKKTAAMIRATPRRALVRALLTKFASGAYFADWDRATHIALSASMRTSAPAAAVQKSLSGAYPSAARKDTKDAFLLRRKTRHEAADGRLRALSEIAKVGGYTVS